MFLQALRAQPDLNTFALRDQTLDSLNISTVQSVQVRKVHRLPITAADSYLPTAAQRSQRCAETLPIHLSRLHKTSNYVRSSVSLLPFLLRQFSKEQPQRRQAAGCAPGQVSRHRLKHKTTETNTSLSPPRLTNVGIDFLH